jgi:hypothetical protein
MRLFFLASLMVCAVPAWATGERVLVSEAAEPLRDSICVSMTCVSSGAHDAVVSARPTKEGLEITVKGAAGQLKLVHVAPLKEGGELSSIDAVRAGTLVVQAIESPKALATPAQAAKPAKTAKAVKSAKKGKLRMLAHR